MHKQVAFRGPEFNEKDYAITDNLCDTVLSLPMHPYITVDDINKVCHGLLSGLEVQGS